MEARAILISGTAILLSVSLGGCDSRSKKENDTLKQEVEILRRQVAEAGKQSELTKQQIDTRERAKIVEAYNICKASYEEVARYAARKGAKNISDATAHEPEWEGYCSRQKSSLLNALAEIDPKSKYSDVAGAMRKFITDEFPRYVVSYFATLYRPTFDPNLTDPDNKQRFEMHQKFFKEHSMDIKELMVTSVEAPLRKMEVPIEPFFGKE
jgi:hypothetical protein